MRLLIVTQAIDLNDPVLGFFHRWVEEFAKHCDHVHVIAQREGVHLLAGKVTVHSLGKEKRVSKLGQIFRFWKLIWTLRDKYDVVFVHMIPWWMVLGAPMWMFLRKRRYLWYEHRQVTLKLRKAIWLSA
ncbi:MAG TPA: hypothetical protein VI913_01320, partial [Candidatus Peribacteraceae bacterium]|nr:hypothetical protein [Candidatus Peribacteraceae bacterium]